ncbi:MAG: phosphoglucosamine mutase, partial [Gammaproteobacteria bacterium]
QTGRPLAELVAGPDLLPQQQVTVTVDERFDPESRPAIVAARRAIETRLADRGRIVLRASGTEPVIRVMVEAEEREEAEAAARELAAAVEKEART